MWQDKLKEIIYLLENSEINEIDVNFWGRRFRVVKSASISSVPAVVQSAEHVSAPESTRVPMKEEVSGEEILSPMPGTYYNSSSPDSDPFVKVGDTVSEGDTLCIIEAMKILNEIEAETSGVIAKIILEDGQAVEYNQPLFVIEPF
ncbi:MAG: acetyl-CoA carboxylase biotin carboxyl carrier protein [Fidelibacterota bacterium]|jgi:acetyl-CoA carboxylase biotin carboxyl carrier protein